MINIIRPIYGLNDSPQRWFLKVTETLVSQGWIPSQLDRCLFWYRNPDYSLGGVLGFHVDDVLTGGEGTAYEAAVACLRKTFPFRKWREWNGEFCGSWMEQAEDYSITLSQQAYAEKMPKVTVRSRVPPETQASTSEVASLRTCNGAAQWLSKETRPDLAAQCSFSQQALSEPTVGDCRAANLLTKRARQFADSTWRILAIPLSELTMCTHTDSAFQNCRNGGTQSGYIVGATNQDLAKGLDGPWAPLVWRSHRLKRVVGSTLAAETQGLLEGLGHCEWLACFFCEALFSEFQLRYRSRWLKKLHMQFVIDCKSLYDHLTGLSNPSSIQDKRCVVDVVIAQQSLKRCGAILRWAPTDRQIADALTKDKAEPIDLLRSAMRGKISNCQ